MKPGADPNDIKLAYNKPVQVDASGALLIAGGPPRASGTWRHSDWGCCAARIANTRCVARLQAGYSKILRIGVNLDREGRRRYTMEVLPLRQDHATPPK